MRLSALALALALGACAFSSEHPLFSAEDGAHPFADGARFEWREGEGEVFDVVYRRRGAAYEITRVDDDDEPIEALFVEIPETPEEDYLIQVRMREDETGRVYAYMWREGETWLIVAGPGALDEAPSGAAVRARHCVTASYGECQLRTRADALSVYRDAVWPHVVAGGQGRSGLIEQSAVEQERRK